MIKLIANYRYCLKVCQQEQTAIIAEGFTYYAAVGVFTNNLSI